MQLNNLIRQLKKNSYFEVDFDLPNSQLMSAIQAFFKFLELPEEIKTSIDFSIAPKHRRGDVGYRHRDPNDHIYNDSKDFFHFHPAIFETAQEFLSENLVVKDFMEQSLPIWEKVYDTTHQILSIFETQYPNTLAKVFDTKHPHILLRFLKYNWKESKKHLAKPHFDAGSFTLAITESCTGLRIGSNPDNLKPVAHHQQSALFMFASNFKKVIDTDELHAGWHDVIQMDETKIGQPYARWALVAFIDAHNVEALPRSETHKWYEAV